MNLLIIGAFSLCFLIANGQKADIIITNGKISTLDDKASEVQAVAVVGNKIQQTGTNDEILALKGDHTLLIDARGNRVIPGLFDSHLHVIRGGRFYNLELRWDGVSSLKRALEMLKEQAARTPKGQWVRVVGGWNEYQFDEKRLPTIEEINEATGDVPTFILYLYGKAWLNKAGLEKLKITSNTPNPAEGLIQKDEKGNPTGLLVAEPSAFILYSTLARLPDLNHEQEINSTLQYMSELNHLGVTAVMDAGGGFQNFPDDYGIMYELSKQGRITVRLPYFLFAQKKGAEFKDYSHWISSVDLHASRADDKVDYHVQGGGENIVGDAADFENFLFPRPELPTAMEGNLKKVIQLLVKNRWPFRLHATYNESIERFLNVIEQVDRQTPLNGLVWFFDHGETVSERNMLRIKSLGGGIAVQHRMAYQGESFIKRYGKQDALASPPIKRMIELGIPVALGTDGTRVASYNPWIALYWITTGKTIGGTEVMGKENTIDRTTALRLLTHKGYELIKEPLKGKIKKGFFADLVILDKDYFKVKEEGIKEISSMLTIVNGKIVYGDQDFQSIAPQALEVVPSWSPVNYYGGYQLK